MTTLWLCVEEDALNAERLAEIRALAPGMEIVIGRDPAVGEAVLDDIEIVAGWADPELVVRMANVRWVQHWAAGVDGFVTRPALVEKDYVLTNGSGIHAVPISEHILALLLAFGRRLHCAVRAQVERRWDQPAHPRPANPCRDDVYELPGSMMVLVGVGAIGARTAQIAEALGVRVIGVRRDPSKSVSGVAKMVGPDALLDVLPEADFVVLTVPLTEATRGMIGEAELRAMKRSAIIVNIGRGGTIQEDVLVRALQEGWIGGAGLDVFETEPLPADSPLWAMDNVIITAHYAGHNPHYDARAMAIFLDNLRCYVDGTPMRNVVDQEAGY